MFLITDQLETRYTQQLFACRPCIPRHLSMDVAAILLKWLAIYTIAALLLLSYANKNLDSFDWFTQSPRAATSNLSLCDFLAIAGSHAQQAYTLAGFYLSLVLFRNRLSK